MANNAPSELDEFLKEADKSITAEELTKRAKSGCEYSTYLQNPSPHHGAFLKANPPPMKKPANDKLKSEEPMYAAVPSAKTNLEMNKKNKQLDENQLKMQKRMR